MQPLSASLVYETLPDGVEAGNGISNAVDGSFKIVFLMIKITASGQRPISFLRYQKI